MGLHGSLVASSAQVVSMNLILYGSLAMVAFSKPWRAMVCNFLDMSPGLKRAILALGCVRSKRLICSGPTSTWNTMNPNRRWEYRKILIVLWQWCWDPGSWILPPFVLLEIPGVIVKPRMLVTGMLVILDMGSLFVTDNDGGTTMVICCLTAWSAWRCHWMVRMTDIELS